MSQYWFTSDYHLGHANIIKYCGRPFKDVEHMNCEIIRRHNERVKETDIVFHIGDFCLSGDSNIDTPSGLKKISNLKKGDYVYSVSLNQKSKELKTSKITKIFKTESSFRLHLILENGFVIKTTENHPFAKSEKGILYWTQAKKLKKGDVLFRRKDIPVKMYKLKKHQKYYMIGYILGYTRGDGHIGKYNIDIQSKDSEGLQRIVTYIKKLYKKNLLITLTKGKYYRLKIPHDICQSLYCFDFSFLKIQKKFPKWYKGFLAGFFDAEGSCRYQSNNWYITMANTDKKLHGFVKKILIYFNFKLLSQPLTKYKQYRICYHLKLKTKDTFKFFLLARPAIKRKYPNLKILANGIKIKKIVRKYHKYGKKFTNYNLTVEPNNNYFVKGILVHNCFKNSKGGKKGEGQIIKAREWEKKLNGKIIYIKGNHDRNNSLKTIIERLVIRYGHHRINLVHNPIHIDTNYKINFTGHVHQRWQIKRIKSHFGFADCINVGVDVWGFHPVRFEELMKRYYQWKRSKRDSSKK